MRLTRYSLVVFFYADVAVGKADCSESGFFPVVSQGGQDFCYFCHSHDES